MNLTPSIENGNLIMRDENGWSTNVIPLDAIASWRTLLGLGSDSEAVAAILQATDPGVLDAETSRNAWTSAYEECERQRLLDLNQTARAATHRALSPVSLALVDDGRVETRRLLGLPTGSVMAMRLMDEEDDPPDQSIPMPGNVDAEALEALLADPQVAARIHEAGSRFADGLLPAGGR
ncbi:hypothetical protein [Bifidobacterium phasiani]|uniref:Uncharacterized protein n=1 Tax=Bifidobacterium phasiani TaxID=2834431 RepID=A0ABS6W894_9BIFI|nr:hypothetical protein [Bifidobacterium phasiani]MBW3081961.1 hypothetical protein [Bifidobacterium phasiani]